MQHATRAAAAETAREQVAGTTGQRRWMIACFIASDDGQILCHRTSWDFPADQLGNAIQALLNGTRPAVETPAPLPLASIFSAAAQEPEDAAGDDASPEP